MPRAPPIQADARTGLRLWHRIGGAPVPGIAGRKSVVGVDVSTKSLAVAQSAHASLPVDFKLASEYKPDATIDLAFCNGVFHHVAPRERLQVAQYIVDCVRPGGLFALWENNPWNPGTRYIMSKVSFDRDAITLSTREVRGAAPPSRAQGSSHGLLLYFSPHCRGIPLLGAPFDAIAARRAVPGSRTQTRVRR